MLEEADCVIPIKLSSPRKIGMASGWTPASSARNERTMTFLVLN